MTLRIGIALGDPSGIGPEITLKALHAEFPTDDTRYIVVGCPALLEATRRRLQLDLRFVAARHAQPNDRLVVDPGSVSPLPASPAPTDPAAAHAALDWLTTGARHCLNHRLDALVTAPLSKAAIIRTGQPFTGQTEYLTQLAGNPPTAMMLLGHDDHQRWLRVTLVTTHLPLRDVATALSPQNIETAIRTTATACHQLGLARARLAVCGLNPHAGEQGLLGTEEIQLIQPTLERLRAQGFDLQGPLAADTVFHAALHGRYDAVIAMFHDQGLPALKAVAFHTGVNWTLGLPFVRTSPDHGPAHDIAGQGIANPSSMRAAIQLARQLAAGRDFSPWNDPG
jgi:4-hydroxythreonine-4-phosphate dehydrogenase